LAGPKKALTAEDAMDAEEKRSKKIETLNFAAAHD
jgi:hypothetical protein